MINHFSKLPIFASLSLLLLFTTATGFAQSDDPFDPMGDTRFALESATKQVRVQVEWIEMSHEKMTELMKKDRRTNYGGVLSANNQPLRDEISELVKKKEAKVIESMMVLARPGERAKIESIEEIIYPTEYTPASIAKNVSKDNDDKDDKESEVLTVTNPTPVAFETRNVGSTLEVDPLLGADSVTIDLNLAPELVFLDRFESYSTHENGGNKTEIKMPVFYTTKVTTNITLIDGQPTLIGAASPRNIETGAVDTDRKILIFVKGEIIITGAPIERK